MIQIDIDQCEKAVRDAWGRIATLNATIAKLEMHRDALQAHVNTLTDAVSVAERYAEYTTLTADIAVCECGGDR